VLRLASWTEAEPSGTGLRERRRPDILLSRWAMRVLIRHARRKPRRTKVRPDQK
jgi:hypothetical protein